MISLTMIFQIIPSQMDWNWPFHTLNNLEFGEQYLADEIWNKICTFLKRKKHLYENLWEGDFDTYIRNMKRNGFWENNHEIIAFFDMMRLNMTGKAVWAIPF